MHRSQPQYDPDAYAYREAARPAPPADSRRPEPRKI